MRSLALAAGALLVSLALAGCGGGSAGKSAASTPEQVRSNLRDAGYEVESVITHGANEGVAQNGKLDADAYLGIEYDPDGNEVFAGVYFFSNRHDAVILARELEANNDRYHDHPWAVRGTRVYSVSGTQGQLDRILEAVGEKVWRA